MVLKYLRVVAAWLLALLTPAARKRLSRALKAGGDRMYDAALTARGWQTIAGAEDNPDDPDPDDPEPDKPDDPDPDDPDPGKGVDDVEKLREELRKHRGTERRAKGAEKERDELRARLKELEDQGKSDHEKALEEARKHAREEALTEAQKERRSERLENAIVRLSKGVALGEGDDAKTVQFDDDLAQMAIERALNNGDIDADDIFDDKGKINRDALEAELADLLKRKPSLITSNGSGKDDDDPPPRRRGAGDADAGKGKGAGKSLEEMSPDDHFKAINK